ncbi:hypothetical protein H8L32_23250 [Undibacterium sp. CY18W]|uniref:Uncharacterized protein n=1 Tax=Undibacterium hunanense TaxID=2762292 RepID=A0ABR6ZXU0_9BURK|nr:hypothetical protein [Undibacterium hunanense]MBC3920400.1 hypothetical protein [Undibacterium hunanense]
MYVITNEALLNQVGGGDLASDDSLKDLVNEQAQTQVYVNGCIDSQVGDVATWTCQDGSYHVFQDSDRGGNNFNTWSTFPDGQEIIIYNDGTIHTGNWNDEIDP